MSQNLKERKQENKRLEEEMKKMEEELDKIRKFKEMEIQKEKLKYFVCYVRQELQQMTIPNNQNDKKGKHTGALRGYGEQLKKQTAQKIQNRLKQREKNKKAVVSSSSQSQEEDNDSENLKYFLNVLGLSSYFSGLVQNKIVNLAQLRKVDSEKAKSLGIPLKEMIKINKKLREMGY